MEIGASDIRVLEGARDATTEHEIPELDSAHWTAPLERFHAGVRDEVLWIRFDVKNASDSSPIIIGERNGVSRFDVWVTGGTHATPEYVGFSGWRAGSGRTSVVSRQAIAAVPVQITPGSSATILVRIPGDGGVPPRLFASDSESFAVRNAERMLLQGTGIGFTTMMVAFSLMLVLALRRVDIAVYSLLTIVSVVLVNYVNGFGPMVLWAGFPVLARYIAKTVVLVYTLVAAEFFRRFLKPRPEHKRVLTAITVLEIALALYILVVLVAPLNTDIRLTAIVSPVAFLVLLAILFVGVLLRVENAGALLASGLGTILVGIVSYLTNLGLFPSEAIPNQGFMVTIAIQVQSAVIAAAIVGSAEFRLTRERLHLREAEDQIASLRQQAIESERMSNIATLVGSVSHELGTPLGIGVTLGTDLLSRTRQMSEDVARETITRTALQEYLSFVGESGELIEEHMTRARELIDGFKAIAADQAVLFPREINLAEYLPRLIRSLRPRFKHVPHELHLEVKDNPTILTVPGYLSQVIINLVNNSLRHGFIPDVRGSVVVTAQALPDDEEGNRRAEILVWDDGRGIPEDLQTRVFTPYFTTAADTGGTGLGLSIVKNLMENELNGSIKLLPPDAGGTCFRLELADLTFAVAETVLQGVAR